MNGGLRVSDKVRRGLLFVAVLVLAFELAVPPVQAADTAAAGLPQASLAAPPAVMAGAWQLITKPLDMLAGNKRRMIQLATVGMCIGLYILMRR